MAFERGVNPLFASALAIAVGAALGAVNGWFVAKVRVHPLIVTLATLAAYRGIAQGISMARTVNGFPEGFQDLATKTFLGLPLPGILFIVFWVVVALVLARTRLGRSIFAIGHNETAARFSGLRVDRIKLLLYTLAGCVAGLAASIQVARFNTAKADMGTGMELNVITAVVFGGTSINGGRGNVFGLLLGVALIHETGEFVGWHWENTELNAVVIGSLLILSVLLHRILSPRSRAED
jgi:rhamnose transport system permease protein